MKAVPHIIGRMLRDPSAALGMLIVVLLIAVALLAPLLATLRQTIAAVLHRMERRSQLAKCRHRLPDRTAADPERLRKLLARAKAPVRKLRKHLRHERLARNRPRPRPARAGSGAGHQACLRRAPRSHSRRERDSVPARRRARLARWV